MQCLLDKHRNNLVGSIKVGRSGKVQLGNIRLACSAKSLV